jgi:cytochrome c oxidase subunit 2
MRGFRSKPSQSSTFPRSSLLLVLALALPLLLSACGSSALHTPLNPQSDAGRTVDRLWWIMFGMSVVIEGLVAGIVIVALVRFRRKPGDPDPVQITGNTRLEIAWTIAPAMVLVVLLVLTLTTMVNISEPKGTTMRVTATGQQWWWEFDYQGMNIVTGNEMHIPVGENVHIDLRSKDVIHGFWVPVLQGKRDVIPGHNNQLWFRADKPGTFRGECTEFCGAEHANMNFIVVAQPRAEFDAWVAAQQAPPVGDQTGLAAEGRDLVQGAKLDANGNLVSCIACHAIDGTNLKAKVGPNLTHVGSRQYIAAGTIPNDTDNLIRWIHNTQDVKPDNKMVFLNSQGSPYLLDDDTVRKIVAYLQSLK